MPAKTPQLSTEDQELFDAPETKTLYVNRLLHKRMRQRAANEGKPLCETVDSILWDALGGKPKGAKS